MRTTFYCLILLLMLTSCTTQKQENIIYGKSAQGKALSLNIFLPKNSADQNHPVLIFVHGGNWNSGSKDLYGFFGRNFARKGIITIIPGYTLSPEANVDQMTQEIAAAVKWVQQNISNYGGEDRNLFVTGHSAGAQLVTSAVLNPKYGIKIKSIAGIILNDAAGIDMKNYLEKYPPTAKDNYLATWSADPENWYEASPINFLSEDSPPFLIYLGKKTYPSITAANENFLKELNKYQPAARSILLNKGHIPMILQYFWPWNKRFGETLQFIEQNQK